MKKLLMVSIALIMLITSCVSENDNISEKKTDSYSEESHEVYKPSNIIEELKSGNERFVVMDSYDIRVFIPYNKTQRISARAVLDTETDVIELSSRESGMPTDKMQMKIESLIDSDPIYEAYKVIFLESDKVLTLVLVDNGFVIGPHPANTKEDWIIYSDFEKQKQVGEDYGYYISQIEDLSFEVD